MNSNLRRKQEEKLNLTKICQTGKKKSNKKQWWQNKTQEIEKINGELGTSNLDAVFFYY